MEPTIVRVRKRGQWETMIEVDPIYGDASSVARRLRSSGMHKARAASGEVIVEVS